MLVKLSYVRSYSDVSKLDVVLLSSALESVKCGLSIFQVLVSAARIKTSNTCVSYYTNTYLNMCSRRIDRDLESHRQEKMNT